MSLSILFGGSIAPILMLFAPVSIALNRDCVDWAPVAKATGAAAKPPCPQPRPPLMLM
jgi:hypothetical protein